MVSLRPAGGCSPGELPGTWGCVEGTAPQRQNTVVNIGRADYNDLMLPDESVSTTHAKLQRREGVWVLVDLDSPTDVHRRRPDSRGRLHWHRGYGSIRGCPARLRADG